MAASSFRAIGGFTLVEALVSAALLATAVIVLAHLVALGATQSDASRRQLTAIVAAQSKLEELRAVPWTSVVDGDGLRRSPPGSLFNDVTGYVEHLDAHGVAARTDADRRAALFVRRWAIVGLDPGEPDPLIVQVCVSRAAGHQAPEACVWTIRTRRP